jgi:energy-coupling factor transporter ATP-binding protein EcfA2
MIERLYVHNFRCLENFTLDFAGQPSVLLVGKNGAGKSAVLHALRVLQKIGRGPNRVKNVVTASDFARHQKTRPMRFETDAILAGKRFKYSVAFEWPSDFYEARIAEESLLKDGIAVFTRKHAQVQLAGGASFGLDWHVFALPVINERPPARSIQEVKAFFAGLMLLSPIPQQMNGFSEEPVAELDYQAFDYASCLRALLQEKPQAYSEFVSYVKDAFADFSSVENPTRGKEGASQLVVTFEQPETRQSLALDFDSLSDGEKESLIIARPAA